MDLQSYSKVVWRERSLKNLSVKKDLDTTLFSNLKGLISLWLNYLLKRKIVYLIEAKRSDNCPNIYIIFDLNDLLFKDHNSAHS